MTQLTIRVDGRLVRTGLQNLDAEIPQIGRLQIYRTAMNIRKGMQVRGPRPGYPIQWDSVKQQKAFFASKGFGGGIPHARTDFYIKSWRVERAGDIGYRLVNDSPGAKYIGGDAYGQGQSKIHRGRWPLFRDESDKEIQELPGNIAKEILVVARRNGLTP